MTSHIQMKALRYTRRAGTQITWRPGDWLEIGKDVGKQSAMLWVAEGAASMPHLSEEQKLVSLVGANLGIVIRGGNFKKALQYVPQEHLGVVQGGIELPFARTLLWSPPAPLRRELIPIGFHRLESGWQVAVPLLSYEKLASNIGTAEDRALTAKVIPDLRIMVYDTRLVYIKKCRDTERLIEIWNKEPGDERLAFLIALFAVKPIICGLPQKWVGDSG